MQLQAAGHGTCFAHVEAYTLLQKFQKYAKRAGGVYYKSEDIIIMRRTMKSGQNDFIAVQAAQKGTLSMLRMLEPLL